MWIYMIVSVFLIPAVMLLSGCFMKYRAPKKINYIVGYRTTMSMKNENTWKFAHEYCGRLWINWGVIMLIAGVVVVILSAVLSFDDGALNTVGLVACIAEMVVLLSSIFPVERALKRKFDKDGNLREG